MRVAITGASGFVGRKLIARLRADGHTAVTLGRSAGLDFRWDALAAPAPAQAFEGVDAVVHLAGEPVAQRWNEQVKRRIEASRITGTRNLVAGMAQAAVRPSVLVSASAIGFYGDTGETAVDEEAAPGTGFLAAVGRGWEAEAARAEELGMRVVRLRFGIVLGREGGALPKMLVPFRMGAGGPLGSGRQWTSWIHIDDLLELILFVIGDDSLRGPVNATSPEPVRNADFTHELAAVLHRPAIMPIPKFALRLRFGEAAAHLVESSRVLPVAAQRAGFRFAHPNVGEALRHLLA